MSISYFSVILLNLASAPSPSQASTRTHSGLPVFPIGIFGVENPKQMARVKSAGFDCFQSYTSTPEVLAELAEAAKGMGMRMLLHPHELVEAGPAPEGWPLAAWYLWDEPDVSNTTPEELAQWEERIRNWSPGVPTAFVVGIGEAAGRFAATGDAIMVDWYPVPHLPLESAGLQVRRTVQDSRGKPVWAVLQAMDWRRFPQRNKKKKRVGRFPTRNEMRFMSYHAVSEGAKGIWFFTDRLPSGRTLGEEPENWAIVSAVARELRAMAEIFGKGKTSRIPELDAATGPTVRAWNWRGRDYALVLNDDPKSWKEFPAPLLDPKWRPLFENNRDIRETLSNRGGKPHLRPYQVVVLERMSFLK